jgi:hypothetical protein
MSLYGRGEIVDDVETVEGLRMRPEKCHPVFFLVGIPDVVFRKSRPVDRKRLVLKKYRVPFSLQRGQGRRSDQEQRVGRLVLR